MAYKDESLASGNNGYGMGAYEEERQERALRLQALCRVYEQADRVLSGDPVQVHVVDDGPAPAWSDGQSIWINAAQIEDFDLAELTQINGLNFHELAHHLYTPRKGTELVKWVISNGYQNAFNILEDQRIETLLTGRYPAIVPYLTATVVRWLGQDMQSVQSNYLCIRGRRYLPLNIRHAFRDMFVRPDLINDIGRIVDEYRLLAFSGDYKRAMTLIEEFNGLLNDMNMNQQPGQPHTGDMEGGPGQCGHRNPISKGKPEPHKLQERDSQRAQGIGTPETPYEQKQQAPGQGEGDPSDSAGDQPGEGQGDGQASAQGDGQDDGLGQSPSNSNNHSDTLESVDLDLTKEESQAQREQRVGDHSRGPAGNAHQRSVGGKPSDATIGALKDELDRALGEIHKRKDVQQDIRTKQRVIIGGDGKFEDTDIKHGKYDDIAASATVVSGYRRFARELERLKQECEPTWNREQPSGRVNVQRWARGCSIDEAFDRWEDGNDGTDIEAVMLVDRSGSMGGGNDVAASEASWIIKRALDHINADVSVYAFDHQAEIVFERGKKAKATQVPFMYGNGGTNPNTALIASERIFMSSRRKNKILFIVTDGDFTEQGNDEIIQRLNAAGVLTAMVLIQDDRQWTQSQEYDAQRVAHGDKPVNYSHGCTVFSRIRNAGELTALARQVVTNAIRKAARAA